MVRLTRPSSNIASVRVGLNDISVGSWGKSFNHNNGHSDVADWNWNFSLHWLDPHLDSTGLHPTGNRSMDEKCVSEG